MTKEELNGKALTKTATFSECPKMFAELQGISPELAKAFRSIMPTLCALNAIVFADD